MPPGQRLWLLHFSRSPAAWRRELLSGPDLAPCREAMARAGCQAELPSGVLVFVPPGAVPSVRAAAAATVRLGGVPLRGRHVICSCEFLRLVQRASERIRSREHVRLQRQEELPVDLPRLPAYSGRAEDSEGKQLSLVVKNTFLEVALQEDSETHVTVSTSDARCGGQGNPRKTAELMV